MAGICPICGEKVGGFTGKAEPFQRLLDEGQALGVYKYGICLDCLKSIVEKTRQEHPEKSIITQEASPISSATEALSMMKLEALKLGADAVYCVRINLTEATSGNGMLMVSASGAAVKTTAQAPEIVKAIEILDGKE